MRRAPGRVNRRLKQAIGMGVILVAFCVSSPAAQAQRVLDVWINEHTPAAKRLFQQGRSSLKARFEEQYDDVELRITWTSWADFYERLTAAAAAGEPPDVIQIGAEFLPSLAAQGVVTPLDEYVTAWGEFDDFYAATRDAVRWQGKTYGLPVYAAPLTMVYNTVPLIKKEMDPEALPLTWDEYTQFVKEIAATEEGEIQFHGTDQSWLLNWETWLAFLWQAGGELLDEKGSPAFNSSEGVAALEMLAELYGLARSPDEAGPPAAARGPALASGYVASAFAGPPALRQVGVFSSRMLSVLVVGLPLEQATRVTPVVTDFFSVPAGSTEHDLAWEFLIFLTEPQPMAAYAASVGFIPARKSAIPFAGGAANSPHLPVFVQVLEKYGRAAPTFPQYGTLTAVLRGAVYSVLTGESEPQKALDEAAKRWSAALGR